jgi:hypothetical protein
MSEEKPAQQHTQVCSPSHQQHKRILSPPPLFFSTSNFTVSLMVAFSGDFVSEEKQFLLFLHS